MNNKRETLKKVAGVSAVLALAPSSWTKPVLNSVVLPAHAQTSSTALRLNPIVDITLVCGDDRNSLPQCDAGDSRVQVSHIRGSISNLFVFEMDIVSGQNIDENATYSIVNNPAESLAGAGSGSQLGALFFTVGTLLRWQFGFPGNGINEDDEIPIGTFNLILRVENPDGESATTSVNITFS